MKFIYGSVERNDDDEFNIGIKTLICPVSVRRARLTGRLGAINRSKIKNRSSERCTIYIYVCVCMCVCTYIYIYIYIYISKNDVVNAASSLL